MNTEIVILGDEYNFQLITSEDGTQQKRSYKSPTSILETTDNFGSGIRPILSSGSWVPEELKYIKYKKKNVFDKLIDSLNDFINGW